MPEMARISLHSDRKLLCLLHLCICQLTSMTEFLTDKIRPFALLHQLGVSGNVTSN